MAKDTVQDESVTGYVDSAAIGERYPKEAPPTTQSWMRAWTDYEAKRAASDAMPLGTEGEDQAVDDWCVAMDHLIEDVPAPNCGAVATKLELALGRCDGPFP